jgi:hypothetical protein
MYRTLQELIAPNHVEFYDKDWKCHGSREELARELAQVTNIDLWLLNIGHVSVQSLASDRSTFTDVLKRFSIADRMSWAANRGTTRSEDIAYCLFGIFDVHLPPLYGEGAEKAFYRLQEEIIKTSTDLSILAWSSENPFLSPRGALAPSPAWFNGRTRILVTDNEPGIVEPFRITNKGLRVKLPLIRTETQDMCTVILPNCHYANEPNSLIGIRLMSECLAPNVEGGRSVWDRARHGSSSVYSVDAGDKNAEFCKIYIVVTGASKRKTLPKLKRQILSQQVRRAIVARAEMPSKLKLPLERL